MPRQIIPAWAIVEARCPLPATIAVLGASERDDVVGAGRALAAAAVTSGRRTALLVLDPIHAESDGEGFDVLTLGAVSRAVFDQRCALWISRYDVLVVCVGEAPAHPLGPHVMRGAAGVVVALAQDRRIEAADHALSNLLAQLGATTVGIVRTASIPASKFGARSSFVALRQTLRALVFRT